MQGWAGYSAAQQQALFDAATIVAGGGLWDTLEEQLSNELDEMGLEGAR